MKQLALSAVIPLIVFTFSACTSDAPTDSPTIVTQEIAPGGDEPMTTGVTTRTLRPNEDVSTGWGQQWTVYGSNPPGSHYQAIDETAAEAASDPWGIRACASDLHDTFGFTDVEPCVGLAQTVEFSLRYYLDSGLSTSACLFANAYVNGEALDVGNYIVWTSAFPREQWGTVVVSVDLPHSLTRDEINNLQVEFYGLLMGSSCVKLAQVEANLSCTTATPTAPTQVTAYAPYNFVTLSWTASSTGCIDHYEILRGGTSCETATVIGTSYTTTYFDNTTAAQTTYTYRIRAVDNSTPGNVGVCCPGCKVKTGDIHIEEG